MINATDATKLPSDPASLQNMIASLLSEKNYLITQNITLHSEKYSLLFEKDLLLTKDDILESERTLLKKHCDLLADCYQRQSKVYYKQVNELSTLKTESKSYKKALDVLREENESLKEQLATLKAKLYGKSSEKIDKIIDNIEFVVEENETSLETVETNTEQATINESADILKKKKKKRHPKRLRLPDHLPRENVVHAAPSVCPICGGGERFRTISEDVSEVLERIPATAKVIRHIRPRCACVNCEQIVQAEAPGNTIDKGKAGPGFLADVIIQKYADHLPLYRQSQIYAREGLEIPRSTMSSWVGRCAGLLMPLVAELQQWIFTASHLHGDDTPVPVLTPGLGKTKLGRIWVYVRDGRPWGSQAPPAVCYFYSLDRKGERPEQHLKDFKGVFHADAYSGYNKIYGDKVSEAGCWAHFRRKFYEVFIASNGSATLAKEVLDVIGQIYQIEEEVRGTNPIARLQVRQERSKELVEGLFANITNKLSKLPHKSATAKAINYGLNSKEALLKFLSDGKIEIDNNTAERSLRAVAVGRKNWLFAGSDGGGEVAAIFYSLIETAKLNNINPWLYLRQVLTKIQDHNSQKLADLLPWNIVLDNTS